MIPGLAIAITLGFGRHEPNPPDRWFGADKAKHYFSAVFVQSVTYTALRSARLSSGASLAGATLTAGAASVGKELWDRGGRGTPSWKDLTWDAAGMGTAAVLLRRTQR
jgi:putative lipoprotein